MQYILTIRMNNAASLLESTDYSMAEISAIVGYDNQILYRIEYFRIIFIAFVGKWCYAISVAKRWQKRRILYGKFYEEGNPGFFCEAAE